MRQGCNLAMMLTQKAATVAAKGEYMREVIKEYKTEIRDLAHAGRVEEAARLAAFCDYLLRGAPADQEPPEIGGYGLAGNSLVGSQGHGDRRVKEIAQGLCALLSAIRHLDFASYARAQVDCAARIVAGWRAWRHECENARASCGFLLVAPAAAWQ